MMKKLFILLIVVVVAGWSCHVAIAADLDKLTLATKKGNLKTVKILVHQGYDINQNIEPDQYHKIASKTVKSFAGRDRWMYRQRIDQLVALGKYSLPALTNGIDHSNEYVRAACAHTLGRLDIEPKLVLAPLKKAIVDRSDTVKFRAAESLGEVGAKDIFVFTHLLELLTNEKVQKYAAEALAKIDDQNAVISIDERLRSIEEIDTRIALVRALGIIGHDSAFPVLKRTANDPIPEVRWNTASSFSNLDGKKAISGLALLAEDENSNVRRWAAWGLARKGGDDTVALIRELFNDENAGVRSAAVQSLGRVGSKEDFSFLVQFAKDENWTVLIPMPEALVKLGGDSAVPVLLEMYEKQRESRNSGTRQVLEEIVVALGELHSDTALEALIDLSGSSEFNQWSPISASLASFHKPESEQALINMLNSQKEPVSKESPLYHEVEKFTDNPDAVQAIEKNNLPMERQN